MVGTAPGARVHAVKVLSDSGYTSWIIAGIDWVIARAGTIEVANMSLGCECSSPAQDTAIANSVKAGVTYAVAAGNSGKDAATFSPANHPDVITVSALADFDGAAGAQVAGTSPPYCRADQDDTLADFSNFGWSVDIAAPGACIRSTWPGGGYSTVSGTSMASPHVAGRGGAAGEHAPDRDQDGPVAIRDTLVQSGNFSWTDESGDGVQKPLLDLHSTSVFNPAVIGAGGGEPSPAPTGIGLAATGYKVQGVAHADLTWSGATTTTVDVHRDGLPLLTTENDGRHTDAIETKGGGLIHLPGVPRRARAGAPRRSWSPSDGEAGRRQPVATPTGLRHSGAGPKVGNCSCTRKNSELPPGSRSCGRAEPASVKSARSWRRRVFRRSGAGCGTPRP